MGRTKSIISRFPDFYQSDDEGNVFYQFIRVFGEALDEAETDLIRVMRSHWVNTADNEGSRGFDTTQKGDLDKIFSLYLENLGGTSLLKQANRRSGEEGEIDDQIYRERIRGLIGVLKNGASTKEGIIAIVAANLGIVGDSEAAKAARDQIEIIEFMPTLLPTGIFEAGLSEPFTVENPNLIAVAPEIIIRVHEDFYNPIVNPRLIHVETGTYAQYTGTMAPGDSIAFFPGGKVLLNSEEVDIDGQLPVLPPGISTWRVEGKIRTATGKFDNAVFGLSVFDELAATEPGKLDTAFFNQSLFDRPSTISNGQFDMEGSAFDETVFFWDQKAFEVNIKLFQLHPGSFMVRIPWDIPGFTEKLDNLPDKPRNQITYIVNKVKAAGIKAEVAYVKQFVEEHEIEVLFTPTRWEETHDIEEESLEFGRSQQPYPEGFEHEMDDKLVMTGTFDYTGFDSLNTFA